ncbi:hypothetical protein M9H77_23340 [Catharanthus roseus]|uniref:Uncharacterized protein n=1 Tax=Catharanthus roseus TaxID=4058 RepID=A0ACC0ASM6_CATRO|nr:hypothetical protein M9H77_23340 [Catharanthus roseus]
MEIKEKERVEEKEIFVERFCFFDSNFMFSNETEHLECSKDKESALVKSERVRPNECFIEKNRVKKKSKEKEIIVLEKSEEVNLYANETNYFFAYESLCVQNLEDSSKDEGGKLAYNNTKELRVPCKMDTCIIVVTTQKVLTYKMLSERTVEVQGDNNCFNHLREQLIVSTPIDMSKIVETKYPDCDIYVEKVILSVDLIVLPFEGYGVILGMDDFLNITLK